MHKFRICITLACCMFSTLLFASAQNGKAGLWDVSSKITYQHPGRVGMFSDTQSATQPSDPAPPLPVCYSQQVIDKFGIILPPSLRDCALSNVVRKPNSMSADLVCTGRMGGKGSIEASWSDDEHVQGKIHFVATANQGPNHSMMSLAWTEDSTGVFKSADCGDVRPRVIPPPKTQVGRRSIHSR